MSILLPGLLFAVTMPIVYACIEDDLFPNKGHRVQRNNVARVSVLGKYGDVKDYDLAYKILKPFGSRPYVEETMKTWSVHFDVPTRRVSAAMSRVRQVMRRQVAQGLVRIRVDRNLRGSDRERGNRGRRR